MPVALFTIDYPTGDRLARRVDVDLVDLAVAGPIIERHLAAAAAATGLSREVIAAQWSMQIIEDEHESACYERVCARRGMLPL